MQKNVLQQGEECVVSWFQLGHAVPNQTEMYSQVTLEIRQRLSYISIFTFAIVLCITAIQVI